MPPAPLTGCGSTRRCRPASLCGSRGRSAVRTVEVRLIAALDEWLLVIEFFATFNGDGAGIRCRLPFDRGLRLCPRRTRRRDVAPTIVSTRTASGWLWKSELFALLFQQSFARKLDAIAFDSQNLDQYLIAFAQFVLHVFHAMLGNLTDVQ
jgi:hypothetical protein